MYAVEIYAAVRQFVFVEGRSRREAASVFGLSRDTISKMCRFSVPPGYVRLKPPGKPKLGPLIPVIDAILAADVTAPPKQRHTAQRIFERLKAEHGFAGGYTVVKDYVRIAKGRSRETFVPLAHPPGHAQVDFGEAIGVIGGVRQKLHVFFMCVSVRGSGADRHGKSLMLLSQVGSTQAADLHQPICACASSRQKRISPINSSSASPRSTMRGRWRLSRSTKRPAKCSASRGCIC